LCVCVAEAPTTNQGTRLGIRTPARWTPRRSIPSDAVVNLAGASIAGGRWTPARKTELRASRVEPTRALVRTLAKLPRPPQVLVSASAIGYYGDRGDETLAESSAPGDDFLAGICREWEAAAMEAERAGIRTVTRAH
jgi:NAD dependent epimerase/dehydratase family enzyme